GLFGGLGQNKVLAALAFGNGWQRDLLKLRERKRNSLGFEFEMPGGENDVVAVERFTLTGKMVGNLFWVCRDLMEAGEHDERNQTTVQHFWISTTILVI